MRLLVVEDDERLREVPRRGLAEQGHVVDALSEGIGGEESAAAGDYDAILLDWNLPGKDGLAIVRALRGVGVATPVLMTSRDTPQDVIAGLDAGADDYIRKPFVFGELEARLRSITRRETPPVDDELRVGDLTFNRGTRRASRGGRAREV